MRYIFISRDKLECKLKEILLDNEKIYGCYIFGSYGTEDFTEESDIDIAIITDIDLRNLYRLQDRLEEELDINIDLLNIRELPKYIQLQITSRGDIVFCSSDEKFDEYLDEMHRWYEEEYPFWAKNMMLRGVEFD